MKYNFPILPENDGLDKNNQVIKDTPSKYKFIEIDKPSVQSPVYNNQLDRSKYDIGVPLGGDFQEHRGQKQPVLEKLGAGLVNSASELTLGTLKNASYLFDLPQYKNVLQGTEQEYSNWFADAMKKTQDDLKLPVYRTQESMGFHPESAGWWGENMPSIFSTLSLAIPSNLAVQGLGKASRFLGGKKLLETLGWGLNEGKVIQGITGAVVSRHMESVAEAAGTMEDTYNSTLEKLKQEHPNANIQDLDAQAKIIAGEAAANNYKLNWIALAQDIPEYLIMFGAFGKAKKLANLQKAEGSSNVLGDIAKVAVSEGIEEGYQYATDKYAKNQAMSKRGLDTSKSFSQVALESTADGDFWSSVFLGALGGAGSQAIMGHKIKKAEEQRNNFYNNLLKAQEDITLNDPDGFAKTQDNIFLSRAMEHAQNGTLDLFKRDLENLKNSNKEFLDNSTTFDSKDFQQKVSDRLKDIDYLEQMSAEVNNKSNLTPALKHFEIGNRLSQRLIERGLGKFTSEVTKEVNTDIIERNLTSTEALLKKDMLELNSYKVLNDPRFKRQISELEKSIKEQTDRIIQDNDLYPDIKSEADLLKHLSTSGDNALVSKVFHTIKLKQELLTVKDNLAKLDNPEGKQEVEKEVQKEVEKIKKKQEEDAKAAAAKVEALKNPKPEVKPEVKATPVTGKTVQPVKVTGLAEYDEIPEFDVLDQKKADSGAMEYTILMPDGSKKVVSQTDGFYETNSTVLRGDKILLNSTDHFTGILQYNLSKEKEAIDNMINAAKESGFEIDEEHLIKQFPNAFPAHENAKAINEILQRPDYNNYVDLVAKPVKLTQKQKDNRVVPFQNKNIRGTRKEGVHISMELTDPNDPKKKYSLSHPLNPEFYEEKDEKGDWKTVDFENMKIEDFRKNFAFAYKSDVTVDDFNEFKRHWKALKDFNTKASQWVEKYGSGALPKNTFTVTPNGEFDFAETDVKVTDVPALKNSMIVYSTNDQRELTGKDIPGNIPALPTLESGANAYWAYYELPNGKTGWVMVYPKAIALDSKEAQETIDKINAARVTIENFNPNKTRNDYKLEINQILEDIALWIKPTNSQLSVPLQVIKDKETGKFKLVLVPTFNIGKTNNPRKYIQITKDFETPKDLITLVESQEIKLNAENTILVGTTTLKKNIPINPNDGSKVYNSLNSSVNPNIIKNWKPKFTFHPENFLFDAPVQPIQKEEVKVQETKIDPRIAEIEKRRSTELTIAANNDSTQEQDNKINAKYDAELAALETKPEETNKTLTSEEADWLYDNLKQITEKYNTSTLADSIDPTLKTSLKFGDTVVTAIEPRAGDKSYIWFERPTGKWLISIDEKNGKQYLTLAKFNDKGTYYTQSVSEEELQKLVNSSGLKSLIDSIYKDTNIKQPETRRDQFEVQNVLQQKYDLKRTYKDIINELKFNYKKTRSSDIDKTDLTQEQKDAYKAGSEIDNIDDIMLKVSDTVSNEPVSSEEALSWMKSHLPSEVPLEDINNLKANIETSGVTLGAVFNGAIYLAKEASKSDLYHEGFHVVFSHILTPIQKRIYLNKIKRESNLSKDELQAKINEMKSTSSIYDNMSDMDLQDRYFEEVLADKYSEYESKPRSIFTKIFDKIKAFVRFITNNKDSLEGLYSDISKGKFKGSALAIAPGVEYKIIPGLSQSTAKTIIATISGKVLSKLSTEGNPTDQKIVEAYNSFMADYDITLPVNIEFLKDKSPEVIKRFSAMTTVLTKQKADILKEVDSFIKKQGFNVELDSLDNFNDDGNSERQFEKAPYEYDPSDGIGSQVKQYLASTLYKDVDAFGREVETALPWREVYNRMLPMLSRDITSADDLLYQMQKMSAYSKQIEAVLNRIKNDTGWNPEDNTSDPESENFINMIKQAFNVTKMRYIQVYYDANGVTQTRVLNENDLGDFKYQSWESRFLQLLNNYLGNDEARKETVTKLNKLAVQIEKGRVLKNDAHEALLSIGINLSPKYLELCFSNSQKAVEDRKDFETKGMYFITAADIQYFSNALNTAKGKINSNKQQFNLFGDFESKDSSAGKIKLIANSDAMFDEHLFLKTYTDANNKTRYSYAHNNLVTQKLNELKKEFRTQKDVDNFIQSNPTYWEHNTLLRKDKSLVVKIISNLNAGLSGDIRDEQTRRGVTMKNTDFFSYLLTMHGYYASQNASQGNKEILSAPFVLTQISDKSTQLAINLPIFNYFKDGKYTALADEDIFEMFVQEYNRIKGTYGNDFVGKKNWILNRVFNTDNHGAQAALQMYEKYPDQGKQAILSVIKSQFNEEIANHIKLVTDNKLQGKLNKTIVQENGGLANYIANMTINQTLSTASLLQIIGGDLAWTKSWEDYVKRASSLIASGTDTGKGNHKIIYIKDRNVYKNTETRENIDEKTYDELSKKEKSKYAKITINDAQAWTTVSGYKRFLKGQGRLNPEIERLMDQLDNPPIVDGKPVYPSNKELKDAGIDFIPTKEVVRGHNTNGQEIFHKMSVTVFSKQMLADYTKDGWVAKKGKEELYNRMLLMEQLDVDHMITKSGSKMFFPKDALGYEDFLTENKGESRFKPEDLVYEADNKYRRLQQENDSKDKGKIVQSNQEFNILGSEVQDPETRKLLDQHNEVMTKMRKQAFDMTSRMLVNQLPNNKVERANIELFLEALRHTVEESTPDSQLLEFLETENGQFKYDSNIPHLRSKFQSLFLATFKSVFRQQVPGVKYTAVSSDGYNIVFDSTNGKIITTDEYNRNPDKYRNDPRYQSRPLRGMTYTTVSYTGISTNDNSDNTGAKTQRIVTPAEIVVPKKFAEIFNLKPGDEVTEEMMKIIPFRVPTQSYHSMAVGKIVDFLPEEYGDTIIAPLEFVWLMGMDFDVDALYSYRKAAYINSKGQTTLYGSETTPEDKFEGYINDLFKNNVWFKQRFQAALLNDPEYKKLHPSAYEPDVMEEDDEAYFKKLMISPSFIKEENTRIENKVLNETLQFLGLPVNQEELEASDYEPKNALWNKLFDLKYQILSSPELEIPFNSPLSEDQITPLVELAKEYQDGTPAYMANSPLSILLAYQDASQGKGLTGTMVNGNSFIQFAQENNITLTPDFTVKIDGNDLTSFQSTPEKARQKLDFASGLLSLIVDNQKNPRAATLNLDFNTVIKTGILIGLGVDPETITLFNIQPTVKKISELTRKSRSLFRLVSKGEIDTFINNTKGKVETDALTKEELKKALELYKNKDTGSQEYKTIQAKVAALYQKLDVIEAAVREINRIMATNRHVGSDKADFTKIKTARTNLLASDKPVIANPDVITGHKVFGNNLQMVKDTSDTLSLYDISETYLAHEILEDIEPEYSRDIEEIERNIVTALQMRALDVAYKGEIHTWAKYLVLGKESVAQRLLELKEKLPNNLFLKYIIAKLQENNAEKSNFDLVISDSRSKLSETTHDLLLSSFNELRKVDKEFAGDLYKYLVFKDNLQFKNNSFIKYVAPEMFLRMAQLSQKINQSLANGEFPEDLIGMTEDQFKDEFIENYFRHSINKTKKFQGKAFDPNKSFYGSSERMPYALSPEQNEVFERQLKEALGKTQVINQEPAFVNEENDDAEVDSMLSIDLSTNQFVPDEQLNLMKEQFEKGQDIKDTLNSYVQSNPELQDKLKATRTIKFVNKDKSEFGKAFIDSITQVRSELNTTTLTDEQILNSEEFIKFDMQNLQTSKEENLAYYKKCIL